MESYHKNISVAKAETNNSKDKIHVNNIKNLNKKNKKVYYDSKNITTKKLNLKQLKKYLEVNQIIPKLPKYLKEIKGDSVYKIIYDKKSNVLYDTVYFNYSENTKTYHDTDKKLNIAISKSGMNKNDIYMNTNKIKKSQISNNEVLLGYQKVSYGPYKKPTGYYDMYVAEFSFNDIEYQLVSSNISKKEFINIIKSFLK